MAEQSCKHGDVYRNITYNQAKFTLCRQRLAIMLDP